MGLFFKKKTQGSMDLPPPPGGEMGNFEMPSEGMDIPDLPELKPRRLSQEKQGANPFGTEKMPEFPALPESENLPEESMPEMDAEEEPVYNEPKGPKFMKITSFHGLMAEAEDARKSIKAIDDSIKRMADLKLEEEAEFEKWRKSLEDTERKINHIDTIIFKGE